MAALSMSCLRMASGSASGSASGAQADIDHGTGRVPRVPTPGTVASRNSFANGFFLPGNGESRLLGFHSPQLFDIVGRKLVIHGALDDEVKVLLAGLLRSSLVVLFVEEDGVNLSFLIGYLGGRMKIVSRSVQACVLRVVEPFSVGRAQIAQYAPNVLA